ncbi:MAG: hypothetical protein A3D89_05805 [Planctomycetes bacterium RIFCSPHIGHO2_02_FULL_52_58]|nr:MAG: hypothetical protein A3D89_05805 [Planctomycetes bacterium RIFCSPHIGHO2_02_FULL_52_58]
MKASHEMSELFKIVLTSSITVLSGILVFVGGQLIAKFFIEPIHEQRRLIGEIAHSLIFYANLYSNPVLSKPERQNEAQKVLRRQACQLRERTHVIPWYKLWQSLRVVIKYNDIEEASSHIIGLSNSVQTTPQLTQEMIDLTINDHIPRHVKKIKELLCIKF